METNTAAVTVSKHYAFTVNEEMGEAYNVKVSRLPNGDFEVTGDSDQLRIFANDICIDDEVSIAKIMDTLRFV